ncbi:hypothetical protein [Elioraea sp.]|uniref:hypothetical protein n=1 Tax=Elioraea sp. TaxID=2185103 RepID=UPI003F7126F4
MSAIRRIKTSFAAGELSAELLGRADLRAYENGAARLANVFILPTGGLRRRPGLRHLATLPGPARLIAFEFSTEQTYLLVLTDRRLGVYREDAEVASIATPWTEVQLGQLSWTQSADTLLIAHPDVRPQRITRTSHTAWTITPWSFDAEPFYRFAARGVTLAASGTSGAVTLTASAPVFQTGHAGTTVRIQGRRVTVNAVTGVSTATATVLETLDGTSATSVWDEAAFSGVRGWPVSLCFHQDRLVIGGSRDLPNRLWLSRTGTLFDFDLGEGLDDQAIEFALVSDQVNAIRAVFSGRHLQVFTSGAEWMVSGDPLTPGSIQLNRQTRVGSPVERTMPPVDVDGATVFVSRSGRSVHEFAYTDVEQAYQAADLAVLARHIVETPAAMAYDQTRRLLHLVMADGRMATLTLFRAEQVTAWTRQETDGALRTVGEVDGRVFVVVERDGTHRLERFDDSLGVDAAVTGSHPTGATTWSGLDHLAGRSVLVVADGALRGAQTVTSGAITTDPPARTVQAGLAFRHTIEPLPPELLTQYGGRIGPVRLVSVTFRVLETAALAVDLGRGPEAVPLRRLGALLLDAAPPTFTGDKTIRALGWRRDTTRPLWRIEGDSPLPMTLLSVTTEMRLNT